MFFLDIGGWLKQGIQGTEDAQQANIRDFFSAAERDKTQQEMNLFSAQQPGAMAAAQLESDTIGTAANLLRSQGALSSLAQGRADTLLGAAALQSLQGQSTMQQSAALQPLLPQLTNLRAITELQNAKNAQATALLAPTQNALTAAQLGAQQQLLPEQTKLALAQLGANQQLLPEQTKLAMAQVAANQQLLPAQTGLTAAQQQLAQAQIAANQKLLPEQTALKQGQIGAQQQLIQPTLNAQLAQVQNLAPAQQALTLAQIGAQQQLIQPTLNAQLAQVQNLAPAQQALTLAQIEQQTKQLPLIGSTQTSQLESQTAQADQARRMALMRSASLELGNLRLTNSPSAANAALTALTQSGSVPAGSTISQQNGMWNITTPQGQVVNVDDMNRQLQQVAVDTTAKKAVKPTKAQAAADASIQTTNTSLGAVIGNMAPAVTAGLTPGGVTLQSPEAKAKYAEQQRKPGSLYYNSAEQYVNLLAARAKEDLTKAEKEARISAQIEVMLRQHGYN